MDTNVKLWIISILAILLFSGCFQCVEQVNAQTGSVLSKLQLANTAINRAFDAVLEAEVAGANVTDLLSQINTAQGILAQAENSFRTGNTDTAETLVYDVFLIAQQVTVDAQSAKQTALVTSQNAFYSTFALTVFGVFVFVLVLFFVWRWFKGFYIKGLSEAKPEVVDQ